MVSILFQSLFQSLTDILLTVFTIIIICSVLIALQFPIVMSSPVTALGFAILVTVSLGSMAAKVAPTLSPLPIFALILVCIVRVVVFHYDDDYYYSTVSIVELNLGLSAYIALHLLTPNSSTDTFSKYLPFSLQPNNILLCTVVFAIFSFIFTNTKNTRTKIESVWFNTHTHTHTQFVQFRNQNPGCTHNASNFMASISGFGCYSVHYTFWSTHRIEYGWVSGAFRSNCKFYRFIFVSYLNINTKSYTIPVCRPHKTEIRLHCTIFSIILDGHRLKSIVLVYFCFLVYSWSLRYFSWQRLACLAYIIALCQMQHTIVRSMVRGRAFNSVLSSNVNVNNKSNYC